MIRLEPHCAGGGALPANASDRKSGGATKSKSRITIIRLDEMA